MPKSVSFSVFVALVGFAIFSWMNAGSNPPIDKQTYVSVAISYFNAAAIISLFVILYRAEKATAEQFGTVIRDNIATVIVALMINLVTALVDIFGYF